MNRPNHIRLILGLGVALIWGWYARRDTSVTETPEVPQVSRGASVKNASVDSVRNPASVPQKLQKPRPQTSHQTPLWKEQVEKTLLTQGGGQLKSAVIEKVDSFNWKMGKVDVPVDSIIVKLEHVKGHRSSFRAIVDSQSGKILQTWDHPVIDKFDNHYAEGIKVDPRYHND